MTIADDTTTPPPAPAPVAQPVPLYTPPVPAFDTVITPAPVAQTVDTVTAPTVENLGNVITNPTARRIVYGSYVIALLILGAAVVYFVAVGQHIPIPLIGVTAVFSFLGIPFGGLALSNTPKK